MATVANDFEVVARAVERDLARINYQYIDDEKRIVAQKANPVQWQMAPLQGVPQEQKRRADDDDNEDFQPPGSKRQRLNEPSHSTAEKQDTATSKRRQRPIRRRKVLPMMFDRKGECLSIAACPDSGSADNIISLETARRIGGSIQPVSLNSETFSIANGKLVVPLGKVVADCSFGAGTAWNGPEALNCVFHVFNTLAVPLIMGMNFLEQTETYSKYKDRLVYESLPEAPLIRVNSVGRSTKSLICQLNAYTALAKIDTGADLDFVSEDYVRARNFDIEEASFQVMYADGSIGTTSGAIRVDFTVGKVDLDEQTFVRNSETFEIQFFVLPDLSSDILIGQDTVEELDIFQNHAESILSTTSAPEQSVVNIIRLIGSRERRVSKLWKKLTSGNEASANETSGE